MVLTSSQKRAKARSYYRRNRSKILRKQRSKRRRSGCKKGKVKNAMGRCQLKTDIRDRRSMARRRRRYKPCTSRQRRSKNNRCVYTTSARKSRRRRRRRSKVKFSF